MLSAHIACIFLWHWHIATHVADMICSQLSPTFQPLWWSFLCPARWIDPKAPFLLRSPQCHRLPNLRNYHHHFWIALRCSPAQYRTLYFAFSVNWLLLENLKKHLLIKTIKSTDTQFRFGIYWIHIFFNWYFGCVNFQRSTVIAQTWKCTLYIYKFLFIFYCLAQSQNKPFVY